jgi:peptidoglycan hydrolase CwlO-like protein
MTTITVAERTARYNAIDALMKELLRAIRKSITTEVALDKAGHFDRSDKLQSERHKMEDDYRALRAVRSTRSDATRTIRAAADTLNSAANDLNNERDDLAKLSKALDAAAKILSILRGVLTLI